MAQPLHVGASGIRQEEGRPSRRRRQTASAAKTCQVCFPPEVADSVPLTSAHAPGRGCGPGTLFPPHKGLESDVPKNHEFLVGLSNVYIFELWSQYLVVVFFLGQCGLVLIIHRKKIKDFHVDSFCLICKRVQFVELLIAKYLNPVRSRFTILNSISKH